MIFDETAEEWKPRHGYKRIKNGIEDIPIVEVKHGQDPYADPWEENRKEKKERVLKNQRNQDRNKMRALGKKKSYGLFNFQSYFNRNTFTFVLMT